jgi:hypothetical protein
MLYFPAMLESIHQKQIAMKPNKTNTYLMKLVKIRQRLINEGIGARSGYNAAEFISKVKNHIHCGVLDTECGAAKFFLHNQAEIFQLIPGKACSANAKLEAEFAEIKNNCLQCVK